MTRKPKMDTLQEIEAIIGAKEIPCSGTPNTGLTITEFAKLHNICRDRARDMLRGLVDKKLWEPCVLTRADLTGRIVHRTYFRIKK